MGEGLAFLDSLEQWGGQGGFGPERIAALMEYLGKPQDKIKSIHVAGTNGKGSVSAALASILGQSGARVGLNISPHLTRLHERIVIDGKSISDERLNKGAMHLKMAMKDSGITLTYHEALTALAFMVFASEELDWMVIEVGLGGRLDASNVLTCPKACVISSIGLDHQHILGESRPEIAKEKAGIFKPGSTAFAGNIDPHSISVLRKQAERAGIPLVEWGKDYWIESSRSGDLVYFDHELAGVELHPGLHGLFQHENMALAMRVARSLGCPVEACVAGIESVFWPARYELVPYGESFVLFDCAHNVDGVEALVRSLNRDGLDKLNIAFGCLDTKNWHEMVGLLIPYVKEWNLLLPQSTRAVPTAEVARFLSCNGIKARDFGSDYDGFLSSWDSKEPLLVAGSMYMVGAFRGLIVRDEIPIWTRRG